MSQQSITEKSAIIRTETNQYGNTRRRVADILDDINETKANKEEISNSEANLEAKINEETQNRIIADKIIQKNIDEEIIARSNADDKKLDKTNKIISAPNATFKYAYITDEDNNTRRILAGDLGKNVANSSLVSSQNAGLILGANWYLDTADFYWNITNLKDRSKDPSFDLLLGQNSSGQVAKVNGKTVFKNLPSILTEDEKTKWKTEMNGGWTTNTMSIGMITPVVIKKSDQNIWVTIRGVNLNVNPSHFSVQIINSSGSTVVTTIPNSQVQLYNDGLSMVFYYNFNELPIDNYKIRINNGVATHTSSMSFSLTEEVNIINTSLISWEKIAVNDDTVINANGGSLTYNGKSSNKAYANDLTFVAGAKSSVIFTNTDNFYIKLNITTSNEHTGSNGTSRLSYSYFGLVPLNSKLSLAQLTVINCNIGFTQIRARTYRINSLSSTDIRTDNDTTVTSVDVLIVRQNGIVYMVMNNGKVQKMALLGDYSGEYCLGFFAQNFSASYGISVNIEEAYTF